MNMTATVIQMKMVIAQVVVCGYKQIVMVGLYVMIVGTNFTVFNMDGIPTFRTIHVVTIT